MRITTQMLNETARKTGVPINSGSLLDHLNNSASDNSLLKALNKSGSVADTKQKSDYEKLEKNAGQLQKSADKLAAKGENSLFEKAKEGNDTEEICKETQALVEEYNNTMKILQSASGPLNDYYYQMLQEAASDNREALESVGITVSKNGKMSVDSDKLKAADIDTLEKALGASGSFTSKVSFVAERVSDNAQAGTRSLTSQYGANGSRYAASCSKYSFWG
ncbi:MAG: hypothetical protein K2O34_15590 [Acetatifactor sp.]|nr:hypothetical protein [Acetatifactor sp.]